MSFVLVPLLMLLPVWNALFDYASVAITRSILRHHLARVGAGNPPAPWVWALCLLLDLALALALALTMLLLLGVFALAKGLQTLGWGVDAAGLLQQYEASPWWASGSVWLVSMAVTNLLPTVAHLVAVAVAVAKATQQWSSRHAHLARWLLPLQGGGRLAPTDADRRLWYLIGARLAWGLFFSVLVMALVMALG